MGYDGIQRKPRGQVIAEARAELQRIDAVRSAAAVPVECGDDIAPAPARGPFRVFQSMRMVEGSTLRVVPDGHLGRATLARADVFDRVVETARRAHQRRHGDRVAFAAPLTPGQVQAGRDYRDLVERYDAGGVKCVSLEAGRTGGGGGEFIDAYIDDGRRIDALRRRIGAGVSMVLRRIRPSLRGARRSIPDRALVDMVCLRDMDPMAVLRAHGWAESTVNRSALVQALGAALDRMSGYRD